MTNTACRPTLRKTSPVSHCRHLIDATRIDFGFEVEITKHIKPGSGIGSSSASSCGAVVAANRLLADRFSNLELVEFAMAGEKLASGSRHADNVAPCIFGGFTLVRSAEPLDVVSLDFPPLYATVIHPQIEIKTSEARAILPQTGAAQGRRSQLEQSWRVRRRACRGDHGLISRSMEDTIVEPARKSLIPKFDEVKAASLAAGALGGGISGSGPSIFMLSETRETARRCRGRDADVYSKTGIEFNIYLSKIHPAGVRII